MINSLQTLRWFATLMIFIHHFGFGGSIISSLGDCAVSIFLCLSGFVLCVAYGDKALAGYYPQTGIWLRKRILRFYPLYITTMAVMFILDQTYDYKAIVLDILLLQSWIPNSDIYFSGNSPLWFISDILFCYILFIPLLRIMIKRPTLFIYLVGIYMVLYATTLIFLPISLYMQSYISTP